MFIKCIEFNFIIDCCLENYQVGYSCIVKTVFKTPGPVLNDPLPVRNTLNCMDMIKKFGQFFFPFV